MFFCVFSVLYLDQSAYGQLEEFLNKMCLFQQVAHPRSLIISARLSWWSSSNSNHPWQTIFYDALLQLAPGVMTSLYVTPQSLVIFDSILSHCAPAAASRSQSESDISIPPTSSSSSEYVFCFILKILIMECLNNNNAWFEVNWCVLGIGNNKSICQKCLCFQFLFVAQFCENIAKKVSFSRV